jgi:electron transport complex protein RnfC
MTQAASQYGNIQIVGLPTRYPMGSEKHLVQTLTGKETPARGLTADIGIVVHNVATALATHQALRYGQPLISRVMTISGDAINEPKNVRALLGTPLTHLVEFCGGYKEEPERLISGGPMMGQPLSDTRIPIVKGSNALLALTSKEVNRQAEMPCIRCSSCVSACPCGLIPVEMASLIRNGALDNSVNLGLLDCIGCGSCSYVCPSHIPLVQYFNYAKGELASRLRAQHKQNETKRLAEARSARMEAIKKAKREKMLQRKKEIAAKKKQQESEQAPEKTEASV